MGIVDLYKVKYEYNSSIKIYEPKIVWNGLIATDTFLSNFHFKRTNKSFECNICRKEKPKNTRYIGENYTRICSDCASEWVENSIKTLQEMQKLLKESKEDLKLNEKKWKREMILGALK